jgi:Ni/Fe-hydrogenase 1 B-type cytochrome subunit
MYFLIINGVVRLYFAFIGKNKDYKEFMFYKEDLKNLIPQVKYYLFQGEHPKTGMYNPLQKLAYLTLPIMALIQMITGLILYLPNKFPAMEAALGGLAAVRGFHYMMMWIFFAIILVHLYLVFTESRAQFWMMFFGKDKDKEKEKKSFYYSFSYFFRILVYPADSSASCFLLPDSIILDSGCRVEMGDYSPKTPSDPDVQISRIRFLSLWFR